MQSFPENLPAGWRARLSEETQKTYFQSLVKFLASEHRAKKTIFPERHWILRALQQVDYENVRVVILGQDPYHGEGQAIGLSFAVPNELLPKPPSLMNIFKELKSDLGIEIPKNQSDLTGWAAQGVLLLNTVLTVRQAQAFSHRDQGWEQFTDQVIQKLNERAEPVIFILWGAAAQKKKALITNQKHFFLESPHPSPLSASRGFFGSRPFSKVNALLKHHPIDWAKITRAEDCV
ncbi:MAG: uracil-DNA glycosylase [Bdellovibrionota bacterium]